MALLKPVSTFCEVPFADDLSALDADVAVFAAGHGTPYTPGTPSHAANAPDAVRAALKWYAVGRDQWDFDANGPVMGPARVVDCGTVDGDLHNGAKNRATIKAAAETIIGAGVKPLLLGGDDSTPIPFIEAFAALGRPITVVQIDAHIDWRNEVHGETHGFSSTMRRASEFGHVKDIVQIGARGPGSARQEEVEAARAWGAKLFTMRGVHRSGLSAAIAAVPEGTDIFLSIDVDGLDPVLMPGVLLPAFGGVTYREMLDILDGAAERGNIAGACFVEYAPESDPTGQGARAIARLACNVIARMAM